MSFKCKIGLHSWDGCKCSECGKTRDEQHDWSKDCEKCTICGQIRNDIHSWNGCKCKKCHKYRDTGHIWREDNCNICSICGISRTEGHIWDGCVCEKCGRMKNENHDWKGCKCSKCNKTRDLEHQYSNCVCINCKKEQHSWNGCICIKCGKIRNEKHKWEGCKCKTCGSIKNEDHIWNINVCKVCGLIADLKNEKSIFSVFDQVDDRRVEDLIKNGLDVNFKNDDGFSLLHKAVYDNKIIKAEILLKNGANVNNRDKKGNAPLHLAVKYAYIEIIILLLQQGADVNLKGEWGDTPLGNCIHDGMGIGAELLLSHGADIYIKNDCDETAYDILKEVDVYDNSERRSLKSLLDQYKNKSTTKKTKKTDESPDSKAIIVYSEKDNIGTRILTADRNQAAYNTWVANGSKPIGSIYFAFKTKEDAYKAMLDIPCIKLATDSKELICTEIIEFGVYWDSYNNKHWEAFLQGNSLTLSTFKEAEKSFVKHSGEKITANEPPVKKSVESNSSSNSAKKEKAEVEFIKYLYPQMMGITCTKEIYKAPNKSIAIEFLKSKSVSKQYYYIEIETPNGWVGKDIDGVYET